MGINSVKLFWIWASCPGDSVLNTKIDVPKESHQYKKIFYEPAFLTTIFTKSTKESKGAKINNRYNQVPHLTQDTNGKVTNSQ